MPLPTCQLGKVARHFGGCGPDPGNEGAITWPPSVRARVLDAQLPSPSRSFHLAELGVYGFDRHETTILAALVTEDPLLLVGRSGTGKTFLLNTLSEALGLEHRHYNASLISFDDLVGFPYPDEAHATVRFLETPATVWGAESVLIDEISPLQARAPEPPVRAGARAPAAGPAAEAAALSLGRDEPVHVGPGRHRGLLGLRGARPGARGPVRADRRPRRTGATSRRSSRRRSWRRRAKGASRRRTSRCDRRSLTGASGSSSRRTRARRRSRRTSPP